VGSPTAGFASDPQTCSSVKRYPTPLDPAALLRAGSGRAVRSLPSVGGTGPIRSSGNLIGPRMLLHCLGPVRTLIGVEPAATSDPVRSSAETERGLWRRSLGGDGAAFGGLFDLHRDRVFRHACRLAGSRQDAEDLVACAFLELWRCRDRVRLVDGSVLPWLLMTATNLGRNAVRGRRRYQRLIERLPRADEHPDAAEVALQTHALGASATLQAGLRALGKIDAQLFALVALEGYSVSDAAGLLNLSVPAAQTRVHRTRVKLRMRLGDRQDANYQPGGGAR
jgi:RNA polymerase sigma factor (sigma-70 family)